jgi:hypothetical protein
MVQALLVNFLLLYLLQLLQQKEVHLQPPLLHLRHRLIRKDHRYLLLVVLVEDLLEDHFQVHHLLKLHHHLNLLVDLGYLLLCNFLHHLHLLM